MNYAGFIDHTLLKPNATSEQIKELCSEAKEHQFAAVCVNSSYVPLAASELKGSPVKVCTVVGFPLGASPSAVKSLEARLAIEAGAEEIDMVLNIGELINGDYALVKEDIKAVLEEVHKHGKILKVIFETCLLSDSQIIKACEMCKDLNVDFIKTSTGFSTGGATIPHVKLMREHIGEVIGVKASGGVRDLSSMQEMIDNGATRIGTSSGVKIIQGLSSDSSY